MCFQPVPMFRLEKLHPSTGNPICIWAPTYNRARHGLVKNEFFRSCTRCMDCRLKKSIDIATRCVHEASLHKYNSFLTLTYNDTHLPPDLSLCSHTLQKFWKKLRKSIEPTLIKYYACGEYGDGNGTRKINPHYHACVFNYDPPDKKFWKKSPAGDNLYKSEILQDLWGLGNVIIGDLTFQSAAYVARYTTKKIYGDAAEKHYEGRLPEKSWSSNGLSKDWAIKYLEDIYNYDEIIVSGKKIKPPKYYDKLLLAHDPFLYDEIMETRAEKINSSKNNLALARFYDTNGKPQTKTVSEIVKLAQIKSGQLDKER